MSHDEKGTAGESDRQGPLERHDNELADILAFAEEWETDPEAAQAHREMRLRAERSAEEERRKREGS
jgi:hypothetical protein